MGDIKKIWLLGGVGVVGDGAEVGKLVSSATLAWVMYSLKISAAWLMVLW